MIDNIFIVFEYSAIILLLSLFAILAIGYFFCGEETLECSPIINGYIFRRDSFEKNINIILKITSTDYSLQKKCNTNERGEFEFDPIFLKRKKVLSIFDGLFQTRFYVEVTTNIDNEKIIIWKGVFRDFTIHKHERSNLLSLRCDVNNPIRRYKFTSSGGYVTSQCSLTNFFSVDDLNTRKT
ncbi:hypothetical protein J4N37_16570 [Vibrio sp. SCSIO 43153]|uniref:DUF6795 domain-containing protein n=1 Tax=Vibrio sp. SCSIO 43153 TaxID=2819098 RepID=UPI00207573FD|nr:DUF6795 domain-containing protein [Vibrio sp. SCSIO 43153]USD52487.1 hypothetical protein J4N37_16570 [Vibrio sp. SCSIO 43153]